MAHHVYNTEGFVIESSYSGEANKLYTLFTRELGMIRATAQGVRLQKSKLRFALQELSQSKVSVVRGKDIWRLTNAKPESSLYATYKSNPQILHMIAQVFALLKRLIPGEEKNEPLYLMLIQAFDFLNESENTRPLSSDEIQAFERLVVLNILHILGYVGRVTELSHLLGNKGIIEWNVALLHQMHEHKKIALNEINRALRESHL